MSGLMGLGPLEENEATVGAMASFHASLTNMVATGLLREASDQVSQIFANGLNLLAMKQKVPITLNF